MKKPLKIILIAIVVFVAAWASYLGGYWLKAWFDGLKEQRIMKNAQEQLIALYNDEYGGKTPQETYEMFIAALQKSDIDLAAKYFIFDKQEKKRKEFEAMKMKEELNEYINKLPKWGELREGQYWIPNHSKGKTFSRKVFRQEEIFEFQGKKFTSPAGLYNEDINFSLNNKDIWKIESL